MSDTQVSNILVLYKSRYGSAKQYAEWITAELDADLFELSSIPVSLWADYSTIIFCSGIYAGEINGARAFLKQQAVLSGKNIIVAACGISDPDNESNYTLIAESSFSKAPLLKDSIKLFLLKGGMSHVKLGFFDGMKMKMMKNMLQNRDPEMLSPNERQLLVLLGKDFDFKERDSIQPLVDYCRTLIIEAKNV